MREPYQMLVNDDVGKYALATQNWQMDNIIEYQKYAVQTGSPTIPVIQRLMRINPTKTINYIQLIIMNLCNSLNIGKNMKVEQIKEAAVIISETFPLLTIQDIVAFTRKAKQGHYGEFYDRLDVVTLTAMLNKYFDERIEKAEMASYEAHQRTKEQFKENSRFMQFWGMAKETTGQGSSEWTTVNPEWIEALKNRSNEAKNI